MRPVYTVRDWDKWFEKNHKDTEIVYRWVAFPTRHDGKSFRRLMRRPDGIELFGAFILIVEEAAKMPVRGILQDENGPLDAFDLADAIGGKPETYDLALNVLSVESERICWLESSVSPNKSELVLPILQDRTGQDITLPAVAGIVPSAEESQPKPARPRKPQTGAHPEFIALFARLWREAFGEEYVVQGAKDGSAVGRIITARTPDRWPALLGDYFSDPDPFIAKSGHTIAMLWSQINRYPGRKPVAAGERDWGR